MEGYTAHKNLYFDVPFISHIDGNLWQGGTEDGLVLPDFIENVVTLYPWESYVMHAGVKSVRKVEMYDSTKQGFSQVDEIARWVNEKCDEGPTLVVCQAGLNRSGLVAARALMLRGMKAQDAIDLLREKRSSACLCNPAFEAWLLSQDTAD
jgi:protein-tyrosine phosphatase